MKTKISFLNGLNTGLWIAQGLLALLFISGAGMKFFMPADKLAEMWAWTAGKRKLVLVTGLLDALVGSGLVLPAIFGLPSQLTFYAAIGGALLMTGAIVFHVSRGETSQIGINVIALIMTIFIAWGRRS